MNAAPNEPLWTDATAAAATGGRATGAWAATGVSIDSRTTRPGDLFVAIRGDTFDGHDFAVAALAAGAVAAVTERRPDGMPETAPLLNVNSTDKALDDLGRAARERTRAHIVAVTGSVGKTGTKEALRLALADQGPTVANEGNLNNHWGLPLSLARMPAATAFGVFEIGMNHPGEIAPLSAIARPHTAVITNVEAVHKAQFSSLDAIADAKAEIFTGMSADGEGDGSGGAAVLNRDNPLFDRLSRAAADAGIGTVISFGTDTKADVRLIEEDGDADGTDILASVNGTEIRYRIGVPGHHWAINSLAVLAAADAAGADVARAARALAGLSGMKGRGRRHTVEISGGAFTVIDDSYNASPVSMNAAFQVVGQVHPAGGGRRIAVLGDMLELGPDADQLHAGLVDSLMANKVNLVFAAGPHMAALWDVLPRAMQGAQAATSDELVPGVTAAIRVGDVVMVKGSAGSKTGTIVDALLAMGTSGRGGQNRSAVNG